MIVGSISRPNLVEGVEATGHNEYPQSSYLIYLMLCGCRAVDVGSQLDLRHSSYPYHITSMNYYGWLSRWSRYDWFMQNMFGIKVKDVGNI